jgi:hypothetical protein
VTLVKGSVNPVVAGGVTGVFKTSGWFAGVGVSF